MLVVYLVDVGGDGHAVNVGVVVLYLSLLEMNRTIDNGN